MTQHAMAEHGDALRIAAPGVRLVDLARAVYERAEGGDISTLGLEGDEARLASGLAEAVVSGFDDLSESDQRTLLETAITLIDQLYAHLPLKQARYGSDPVQQLRLLRRRCGVDPPSSIHRGIERVFTEMRDAHTRYVGPTSLAGVVAYLPFMVERYGPTDSGGHVVSHVAGGRLTPEPPFGVGAELISWNGVPMQRAVEVLSDNFVGSHRDARLARGVESLTQRALQYVPLPDEHWVVLGFRTPDGTEAEARFDWRVFTPDLPRDEPVDPSPPAAAMGIDFGARAVQQARKDLFATSGSRRARPRARGGRGAVAVENAGPLEASIIPTALGDLGYLRIWDFSVRDHHAFVSDARRILARLPDRGLVVDIRNNPGGLIWAAERMLQLLTPNRIEPTRFSLPVTDFTVAMADDDLAGADLLAWRPSLNEAVSTAEPYSQPIPLTDPRLANDIGQTYGGPVVCLADARTYSSGDLFAAGFVDNEIGPLVTVGAATGGGGANVWTYELAVSRLRSTGLLPAELPAGCTFTFSFRRATRARAQEGRPIEDVGVAGAMVHHLTRRDVMAGNVDLLAAAVEVLAAQRHSAMTVSGPGRAGRLTVRSKGLDNAAVTVDGSSTTTVDLSGSSTRVDVPEVWEVIDIEGRGAGQILQRRRITARRS